MSRHLHFYFSNWTNESRAWRAGTFAQDQGYATTIDYIGYKDNALPVEEYRAVGQRILRLGAEPARPGSRRLLRALAVPVWFRACLRESKVDDASLIIAHSLAALPVAVRLAQKNRLPLLYDAHELETERAGWSKSVRKLAKAVEARLIQSCDHVMLVNDSILKWYLDAYPGIDASVVRNVPFVPTKLGQSTLRQTLRLAPETIIYVYCGSLGGDRGLSELIEAFRGLGPERHLVMIGYGHGKGLLVQQAQGLDNVHFHNAVPQSELITLLSGADVGLVILRAASLSYEYALPNKLFEYAAARLGIITGKGPELLRFATEYPASRCVDLNVPSLRQAVMSWSREELQVLKSSLSHYSPPTWQNEQHRLNDAFDRAIENGRRRWS
jgi:glycosyltransferase involved in cell wall biosynthesis